MTKLAAPTAEAQAQMTKLGITWTGLIPTLQQISDKGITLDQMKLLIPDERASKGVLALSQNIGMLLETVDGVKSSAGAMQSAFEEMLKSPQVQGKLLVNVITLLRDRLIQMFAPAIMSGIQELATQFKIIAIGAGGTTSAVNDTSSAIRNLVGVTKIAIGTVMTVIDTVLLAFEVAHRGTRAFSSTFKGDFADASLQMRTLGNDFLAVGKAIDDRIKGIQDTFAGKGAEDIGKPAWLKTLEDLQKDLNKTPKPPPGPGGDEAKGAGPAAALLAEMRTVASEAKIAFAQLDQIYADGTLSARAFYESKRTLVAAFADAEIKYLQQVYELTDDENEKRQINAQILSKMNEAKAEKIKLDTEEVEAIKKVNEAFEAQAQARSRILQTAASRVGGGTNDMQAQHAAELAALKEKHLAELEMLEENEASKDEILQLHALQRQEMSQLADQQRIESFNNWLSTASTIVGQIQSLYQASYQREMQRENSRIDTIISNMRKQGASEEKLTKKKQELRETGYKKAKEIWEKEKRAQIALAIIGGAQAVLNALQTKPFILGLIMAGLAVAVTAVQISNIRKQTFPGLAAGGRITQGTTSKTDDVNARLSKGEFVSPADSVNYYGPSVYEAMRQRKLPRGLFAGAGSLAPYRPTSGRFAEGGLADGPGLGNEDGRSFTIVNYLDERLLTKYLDTPEGQKAILNVMSDHSYEVRRIVG